MIFIPKVGETCICIGLSGEPRIKPKYVGSAHVLFDYGSDEFSMLYGLFKPIKSPAEIEREELALVIHNTGRTNHPTDIADAVINAGYSKRQVKSLSWRHAFDELEIGSFQYEQLVDGGYIIQGGDK